MHVAGHGSQPPGQEYQHCWFWYYFTRQATGIRCGPLLGWRWLGRLGWWASGRGFLDNFWLAGCG